MLSTCVSSPRCVPYISRSLLSPRQIVGPNGCANSAVCACSAVLGHVVVGGRGRTLQLMQVGVHRFTSTDCNETSLRLQMEGRLR